MSIDKDNNGVQTLVRPPSHPVPQLQKPFEESMMESVNEEPDQDVPTDAMTRRTILLESAMYQRVIAGRWKQKSGEKYHPLWKLVAQLSFGMHLLAEGLAISEDEVMRILQSHVDDIDAFLERTTEDFDLAQSDIHERIRCLRLPLAHGEVFDRMLEDRGFRASILDGNEKIDHVISRTKKASKDALKDVQKGFDATNVLEKYLSKLNSTWKRESPEHEAVVVAMLGNVEGWRRAFLELHLQGNKLAGSLNKLAEVVTEMQQRAAAVSRNIVAKTQKTRHINSQNAGRVSSQLSAITEHKPLPTEPGRPRSTRNSSRSTHMSGVSSRPNSGNKSSQGRTSQSHSASNQSSQSPAFKRSTRSEAIDRNLSPDAATIDGGLDDAGQMHSIGGLLIQPHRDYPVELPADVPEDVFRQAPVSAKNRLSLTLGLKAKDNANHRISSIYYPKALGDLLKSPAMSSLLLSPQPSMGKVTPVERVMSPVLPDGDAGIRLSREKSPAIAVLTPDTTTRTGFANESRSAARASARASIVDASQPVTRRSSIPSLAFTSHPSVMAMATPPAELPVSLEAEVHEERPASSSSRKHSQPSSLGEPGPELSEGTVTRSVSLSENKILVDTSIITLSVIPASAEEETFAAAAAAAQREAGSTELIHVGDQATVTPTQQDESLELGTVKEPPPSEGGGSPFSPAEATTQNGKDQPNQTPEDQVVVCEVEVAPETPVVGKDEPTGQNLDGVPPAKQFVAELEAIVAQPVNTPSAKDFGPVELEAPHQTFKLPPRPIAASQNPEKEVPRASIINLDDFFKLPTQPSIKPGAKARNSAEAKASQVAEPLKLKLARKDGKIVPVQVNTADTSGEGSSAASKLRMDVVADILETMSYTPPGSPIQGRSASTASSNSAQRWSQRSPRSLGPPAQAPPPPGPGGRPMVNPDFASAAQFEGERKQKKKKSSSGSKSGWRSLFGGSTNSDDRSSRTSTPTTSASETSKGGPGGEMLTTTGKDVLWFKGDAQKPVGVSSA